jgi:MFS superfamily sulfate permease-like transporter
MIMVLAGCQKERFLLDLMANLTTVAVVILQRIMYAGIADLPVLTGLYLALVSMRLCAVVRGTRALCRHRRIRPALSAGPGTGNSAQFPRPAASSQSL